MIASTLLGFPQSIIDNFMCLPLNQAIHLSILVGHQISIELCKGRTICPLNVKIGMVRIGLFVVMDLVGEGILIMKE